MHKKIFLLFLLAIFTSNLSSANSDSLISLLEQKTGAERLEILLALSQELQNTEPAKCLVFGDEALKLSLQLKDDLARAKALLYLGRAYYLLNDILNASDYLTEGLKIIEKMEKKAGASPGTNSLKASLLQNLGFINVFYTADYNQALDYFIKSQKISEELTDYDKLAYAHLGIGFTYRNIENYESALEHFSKAVDLLHKSPQDTKLISALNETANIYVLMDNFEKSLEYRRKALQIAEEIDYQYGISFVLHDFGFTYMYRKDYEKALEYFMKDLEVSWKIKLEDKRALSIVYANIGNCYYELGDSENALRYLRLGLENAKVINNREGLVTVYDLLSRAYSDRKEYKPAWEYLELYCALNDTIFSEEKSRQLAEIQTKYETENKEQEIALLKKEREKNNILANMILLGLFSTLMVVVVLFLSNRITKKLNRELESQNREIALKNRELSALNEELQSAIREVKVLSGLLPICANCKKVRDDKGYWKQIEEYIRDHSEANFSHGICPECMEILYPQYNHQ